MRSFLVLDSNLKSQLSRESINIWSTFVLSLFLSKGLPGSIVLLLYLYCIIFILYCIFTISRGYLEVTRSLVGAMKTVDGLNRLVICHSWWSLLHWSICIQSVHFCPQGVFFHQNSTWLLQMYILLFPLIGSQSTLIRSPIKTVAGTPGRRAEDRLPSSSAGFSSPSSGCFLYFFFNGILRFLEFFSSSVALSIQHKF